MALGLSAFWHCHAFASLDDCEVHTDCARGLQCNASNFCERAPLRIGLIAAETGDLKFVNFGTAARAAAAFFERSLKKEFEGRFAVESVDDFSKADGSVTAARTLLTANVFGIVGPITSSQTSAVQELTFPARLLQIAPFAGARVLGSLQPGGARKRYLYQLTTTIDRGAAPAIVRYAYADGDGDVIARCAGGAAAIVYSDDTTGQAYNVALTAELASRNVAPTVVKVPTARQPSYENVRAELRGAGASCVFVALQPELGGALIAESTQAAEGFQFLTVSLLHDQAFLDAAGTVDGVSLADGVIGADIDGRPPTPEYEQLQRDYKAALQTGPRSAALSPLDENGQLPNLFASHFDAFALLALARLRAEALADNGVPSPSALRNALLDVAMAEPGDETVVPATLYDAMRAASAGRAIDYKGASGALEFDDEGFVKSPTLVWRVDEGKFVNDVLRYDESGNRRL